MAKHTMGDEVWDGVLREVEKGEIPKDGLISKDEVIDDIAFEIAQIVRSWINKGISPQRVLAHLNLIVAQINHYEKEYGILTKGVEELFNEIMNEVKSGKPVKENEAAKYVLHRISESSYGYTDSSKDRVLFSLLSEGKSKSGRIYTKSALKNLKDWIKTHKKVYADIEQGNRKMIEWAATVEDAYIKNKTLFVEVSFTSNPKTKWIEKEAHKHPSEVGLSFVAYTNDDKRITKFKAFHYLAFVTRKD